MNRVIFSDNGTLKDYSTSMNKYVGSSTKTFPVVAADDFIFIGSDLPFNHRYIDVDTGNTTASAITVAVWDGTEWKDAVEVNDETEDSSGATLAQSGLLSWVPDKDEGWMKDDTVDSNGSNPITGLSSVTIYGLYWARLKFSADIDVGTTLNYFGQKFNEDADLGVPYPELVLSSVQDAFKSGKTDWDEQAFLAAEEIASDLVRKRIAVSRDQILEPGIFKDVGVHKTAEIIFRAFGTPQKEKRDIARADYAHALNKVIYHIDKNKNARRNLHEKRLGEGWLTR